MARHSKLTVEQQQRRAFLALLDRTATEFNFRTFAEGTTSDTGLARNFTGSIEDLEDQLTNLNARGTGVFVVVNAGGHKSDQITRVRAVFADLDGAPVEPVYDVLEPHIVLQTSGGRFHAYWLVDSAFPVIQFSAVQKAIAAKFGADPSVCDLPRVMRMPGFLHNKGQPYPVRFKSLSRHLPRYRFDDIRAGLSLGGDASGVDPQPKRTLLDDMRIREYDTPRTVAEGERNTALLSYVGRLRGQGVPEHLIPELASDFNMARCQSPLPDEEVLDICSRYRRTGSDGASSEPARLSGGKVGFSDQLPPEREFVFEDLIFAKKTALLGGLGGVSKTMWAMTLAIHVALGREFLGKRTREAGVLMILGEEDQDEINRRFNAICSALALSLAEVDLLRARILAHPLEGQDARLTRTQNGSLEATGFQNDITSTAARLHAECGLPTGLIVLDHAGLIHGGEFNSREDVVQTMRAIAHVSAETSAASLVLAHSPKSSVGKDKSDQADIAGSAAWVDLARAAMVLRTMSEDDAKTFGISSALRASYISMEVVKNNYGPTGDKFWLMRTSQPGYGVSTLSETVLTKPTARGANAGVHTRVKDFLRNHPGQYTKTSIRDTQAGKDGVLKASKQKVSAAIEDLLASGEVVLVSPTNAQRKKFGLRAQVTHVLEVV